MFSLPDFGALPHLGLGVFCRRRALLRHRRPGHQLRSFLRLQTLLLLGGPTELVPDI